MDESRLSLGLTSKQKTAIHQYIINDAWTYIDDNLLTTEQRDNPKTMRIIALDMEVIFRQISSTFGLCSYK